MTQEIRAGTQIITNESLPYCREHQRIAASLYLYIPNSNWTYLTGGRAVIVGDGGAKSIDPRGACCDSEKTVASYLLPVTVTSARFDGAWCSWSRVRLFEPGFECVLVLCCARAFEYKGQYEPNSQLC